MSPPRREARPAPTGPGSTTKSPHQTTRPQDMAHRRDREAISNVIEVLEEITAGIAISLLSGSWLLDPTVDDLWLLAMLLDGAIDELGAVA
jgi:hypothetical protein